MKVKGKGYLHRLLLSLHNLLSARELLSIRNIRMDYLHYFFAFPIAMIFINVQDFVLDGSIGIFGLSHTTVTFLSFVTGAIAIFAISSKENISAVSKISAAITACGFVPWLFLPNGRASLLCSIVFMIGIGGCVSGSSFSYVFMLNNAERFFGSALMVLLIESVELLDELVAVSPIVRKIIAFVMIFPLCACMLLSKKGDYAEAGNNKAVKFDPSVWLVLYIFLSYFAIRITGFYAPAFQHPANAKLWGGLALFMILLCVIVQAALKKSVWTLCNVFFLTSVMAHVMWYSELPQGAYLFSELKEVGLLIALYLVGCVTNKFCDFRMHKRLVLLTMATVGILYAGIDVLYLIVPTQSVAAITTAVLFVMFLLLSPAFSQFLFFADWSKEFRLTRMYAPADASRLSDGADRRPCLSLDDTNLSPREKQVVLLLLKGMTLRQVAPELGLTASTVSTYSKTIYKKLGINSRAELFLLFGYTQATEVPVSDKEK